MEPEVKEEQRSRRHGTNLDACATAFYPERVPHFSSTPKTTSEARPAEQTKLSPRRVDDDIAATADYQERNQTGQLTKLAPLSSNSRPSREPVQGSDDVSDSDNEENENSPGDHVTAMLKIQLLNGMKPAQFAGNPSEFPFFRKQVRTHLEGNILTDAQRVEYLPKFLSGEALEVIKRNRGCSYKVLIRTLEEQFRNPIQVAQHCIEQLVSGPKVAYGDNAGLLNFAEGLNTATKVLKGEYEREISVATNLKRVVNRLPADIIGKWQNENYKIVSNGSTARLNDVAGFVKKQATIRNDPVYGTPKRDNREVKYTPKSSKSQSTTPKQTTIASMTVNSSPARRDMNPANTCVICKGPSHKLDQCPVIEHCDQVAIRRSYAASYKYCFNCGRHQPGHGSSTCSEPPACTHCPGSHLTLLHQDSRPDNSRIRLPYQRDKSVASSNRNANEAILAKPRLPPCQNRADNPSKPDGKQRAVVTSAGVRTARNKVLLNVVPVVITAENGKSVSTYAFLDNGCTDTLIDQELADKLGLKGVPQEIQINTITNRMSQRVRFTLTSADGNGEEIEVEDAYIFPDFNQSEQALPTAIDVSPYPHLRDLFFPDVDLKRVAILIGSNLPNVHVQKEVRMPEDKEMSCLYGYRYPLGWSLAGPLDVASHRIASLNAISVDHQLNDQVERFWTVEDYGAVKADDKPLSVEDRRALRIIQDTTQIDDGHYEVGLLWKEDNIQLPNNLSLAERRLASLKRRLTKPGNEELSVMYKRTMNDYIAKGYARRLDPDEVAKESQICWYLPHHPIVNPNKPGKVRIVYDAAAEFKGQSLNKNLLSGPDMTNSLLGVLLRFRQDNVGIATDVEAMFHQIESEGKTKTRYDSCGGQTITTTPLMST